MNLHLSIQINRRLESDSSVHMFSLSTFLLSHLLRSNAVQLLKRNIGIFIRKEKAVQFKIKAARICIVGEFRTIRVQLTVWLSNKKLVQVTVVATNQPAAISAHTQTIKADIPEIENLLMAQIAQVAQSTRSI